MSTDPITDDQVRQALVAHREWLESDGARGQRADFSYKSLSNINLHGERLDKAVFRNADLSKADLSKASLSGADLTETRLASTNLRDANLKGACLEGVEDLTLHQLAGASLADTKIPEGVDISEAMAVVERLSKKGSVLVLGVLFACVCSWLTVGAASDASMVVSSTTASLPFIGASVPIVAFYLLVPVVLVFAYFYYQAVLTPLWEELGNLPAVLPEGRTPIAKIGSSLLLAWPQPSSVGAENTMTLIQHWIAVVLVWGLAPLTTVIIWMFYWRRHDLSGTLLHVVCVTVIHLGAVKFYRVMKAAAARPTSQQKPQASGTQQLVTLAGLALILFLGLSAVSYAAITGVRTTLGPRPRLGGPRLSWIVPDFFSSLGVRTYLDFSQAQISLPPGNEQDATSPPDCNGLPPLVARADLRKRDLRQSIGARALLSGVDLGQAVLSGAFLNTANFRGSNMESANLQQASLWSADLRDADLHFANMNRASLTQANLQGAVLCNAKLIEASLYKANLRNANLTRADLRGADLRGADLTGANLDDAKLFGADLSGAKFQSVRNCNRADFSFANTYNAQVSDGSDACVAVQWGHKFDDPCDWDKWMRAEARKTPFPFELVAWSDVGTGFLTVRPRALDDWQCASSK